MKWSLAGLWVVLVIAGVIIVIATWLVARLAAGRALEPLRRLAATADQDLERQRRFVADASHELRNPLAIIRANLSFLEQHPEAEATDRQEALSDSNKAALRMSDLIDDLLQLARLDAGAEPIRTNVRVDQLIKAALERTAGKGQVRVESDSNATIDANAEDIVRLIINLVDNALRHGGTPVTISAFNQDDDVVITVTDHGPGLPPIGPELIFDRFYRGDASRPAGGTGLGLAIARGLAEQHGGTLTAGNAPEGGAVFTLRLPRS